MSHSSSAEYRAWEWASEIEQAVQIWDALVRAHFDVHEPWVTHAWVRLLWPTVHETFMPLTESQSRAFRERCWQARTEALTLQGQTPGASLRLTMSRLHRNSIAAEQVAQRLTRMWHGKRLVQLDGKTLQAQMAVERIPSVDGLRFYDARRVDAVASVAYVACGHSMVGAPDGAVSYKMDVHPLPTQQHPVWLPPQRRDAKALPYMRPLLFS